MIDIMTTPITIEPPPPPQVKANGRAKVLVPQSREPLSPLDIVDRWRAEGPLQRVSTGIDAIDRIMRGGIPVPWRMTLVGAPSAGKTYVETIVADHLARACAEGGLAVGILAVDEDPDDITKRLAQIAGFSIDDIEARDPETITDIAEALRLARVKLYDFEWTIDAAADDLARRAAVDGRRAALFVDSLQTASSAEGLALREATPRSIVEANARAVRAAATNHRMLVVSTSEANRAAYRGGVEDQNPMAAGAESRALEFSAQTLLVLKTPKGHPDVVHVEVPKNRGHVRGVAMFFRLDRERHALTECGDPALEPAAAAKADETKRAKGRASVLADADVLADVLRRHPSGIHETNLRAEIRRAGIVMGTERLKAAQAALADGHRGVKLINRGPAGERAPKLWTLDPC